MPFTGKEKVFNYLTDFELFLHTLLKSKMFFSFLV